MSESRWLFGKTKTGEDVTAYKISSAGGAYALLLDYGAALQSLFVPDNKGGVTDVVVGFDSVEDYEAQDAYIGATIGRFANRIGAGKFSLGGKSYSLAVNNGPNSLHGGAKGFDKYVWQGEVLSESAVRFTRLSPDGEENYPGNLNVSVTYSFDDNCALSITYEAVSDADTVVNLTNHSYFDLSGCGKALEQELMINAHAYLESDEHTLATGKILPVEGSPFDFNTMKAIGRDIEQTHEQLILGAGYDHCYCLSGYKAAVMQSNETGIRMEVYTQLPGMQLYSGNYLGGWTGKNGRVISRRSAIALETQLYPNGLNCYGFPSPILHGGEKLQHTTKFSFSVYNK